MYVRRIVDSELDELIAGLPALLLVGPRGCGKTTTAARRAASVLRLDRPAVAAAVGADPDVALAGLPRPTLVDEWQIVPSVLGAIKRAVDEGAPAGSFLVTGSVRADLTGEGWPMTGRIVRTPMWPLTQRETTGRAGAPSFFDRLLDDPLGMAPVPDVGRRECAEAALAGGFPQLLGATGSAARQRFLRSYVDEVVLRDSLLAGADRDPIRLRRYLAALAANMAGAPQHNTVFDAADLARVTALAYDDVLEMLVVTERVPAWTSNRLQRLVQLPKRYLVEPALLGPLLGIDARAVLRDADLLGRVIDGFVLAQLRPELSACSRPGQLFHVRDANHRHEVDLLVEFANGDVVGIEIKASAAPKPEDARHLRWLRDRLGDRFVAGVVFHTGPLPFRHEPDIHFLPISTIWGG